MNDDAPIDGEKLRDLLLISPFHRWLGLEIKSQNDGQLELVMPWRDEIVSNPMVGAAHGGILASLIDLTGLYSLIAAKAPVKATADLRVDYHKPAIGGTLTAIGRPIKLGRQISVAETSVFDSDKELLASGRGAYISR
ncbi:MAG: hotdog fold thioesterase [Pseudomonadota bacterium]